MVTETERISQQKKALEFKARKQLEGKFGGTEQPLSSTVEALKRVTGREYKIIREDGRVTGVAELRKPRKERVGVVDKRVIIETPEEYQRRKFQEVLAVEKAKEEISRFERLKRLGIVKPKEEKPLSECEKIFQAFTHPTSYQQGS